MEKLECKRCKKIKTIDNFNKVKNRKRGYHVWCKQCIKIYDHERHKKNREKILKQKKDRKQEIREWFVEEKRKLSCKKCGDERWYVLCFHHKNGEHKDTELSIMVSHGFSKKRILEEMNKCDIFCMNCHTELHYFERLNDYEKVESKNISTHGYV